MFVRILVIIGVLTGSAALWGGLEYYVVPLQERPFSPLHELYAPTGLIGQGMGIVGTLMIVAGVVLYALRKRLRILSRLGSLRAWLHFHIFLCLLGPFLVLLHTTFKFGGLVAISFWSMALVVASGVFGRWVYVWIPKTVNGRFLARSEIRDHMAELLAHVGDGVELTPEQRAAIQRATRPVPGHAEGEGQPELADRRATTGDRRTTPGDGRAVFRGGRDRRRRPRPRLGLAAAVMASLRHRLGRRKLRARLRRDLASVGIREPTLSAVLSRLEEERRVEQQIRVLEPFQRAFRYWHAFHLPLAVVMLLILVVHVGVAVALGYTWIF